MNNHDLLAIGVNPALDMYYQTDRVRVGAVNRVESVRSAPGGKAINFARAYQRLGGRPLVVGILGGSTGRDIESGLRQEGISGEFVQTSAESRKTVTVVDDAGTTVFLEQGGSVEPQAFDDLIELVGSRASTTPSVVLNGSVPPTAPKGYLSTLVRTIRRASSARIAIDATGEALRGAANEGVDLIKVNAQEFAEAFQVEADDPARVRRVFDELRSAGLAMLAVTSGAGGALVMTPDDCFTVRVPVDRVISSAGAGDAFLAGLLRGLDGGISVREAFQLAAASGAAATQVVGAGFIDPALVQQLLSRAECTTAGASLSGVQT